MNINHHGGRRPVVRALLRDLYVRQIAMLLIVIPLSAILGVYVLRGFLVNSADGDWIYSTLCSSTGERAIP